MSRNSRSNTPVYALLALVLVLFFSLAALLVSYEGQAAEPDAGQDPGAQRETISAEEETIPAWLEPKPPEEKEPPEDALSAPEILADAALIAHGLGAVAAPAEDGDQDVPEDEAQADPADGAQDDPVDGEEESSPGDEDGPELVTVLNCLEGFLAQYEAGVRVFEADLRLTADMEVVLRHDWRAGWQEGVSETAIPTLEEFLDKPILGEYTPLSFKDLLLLMEEYPDICVITDTKFTEAEVVTAQFSAMLDDASELGLSYLFDRFIIQVYDQLMFQVVDSLHHFPHYIYTLYATGFAGTEAAFREAAGFCADSGVMGLTLWDYWWRESYAPIAQELGVTVYVHTVNDAQEARALLEEGVSGIYTDSLVPADLEATEAEATEAGGGGTAPESTEERA